MKIGLFTVVFNDRPLEEVAKYASGLGYEMVELAAWRGSNHFDTDRAAEDISYAKGVKKMLADHGLEISALSNHLSSQMVLPFKDASLDEWAGTSSASAGTRSSTSSPSSACASPTRCTRPRSPTMSTRPRRRSSGSAATTGASTSIRATWSAR